MGDIQSSMRSNFLSLKFSIILAWQASICIPSHGKNTCKLSRQETHSLGSDFFMHRVPWVA